MADNETLVSWRFDMDKFLRSSVRIGACLGVLSGPELRQLSPTLQAHDRLFAQKTLLENELQIGSTFLHFFDKFQVLFAIQILLERVKMGPETSPREPR